MGLLLVQAHSRLAAALLQLRHGAGAADALEALAGLLEPEQGAQPKQAAEAADARRRLADARAMARHGLPDHYAILEVPRGATAEEVGGLHGRLFWL